MLRVIAGAMACAWALAGWRNMPRLAHPAASAAGLAIAGSILIAYWLGGKRVKESAVAMAVAKAEATALASVQASNDNRSNAQVVVHLDPGVGALRAGQVTGLDSAPWMVGAHRAPELLEETDIADVLAAEFTEQVEQERA